MYAPQAKKFAVSSLFSLLLLFALLLTTGCGPNDEGKSDASSAQSFTDQNENDTRAKVLAAPLTGNLKRLLLTKTAYDILKALAPDPTVPGNPQRPVDKLVFQFLFDNAQPNYPTLRVYVGRKGNK